MTSRLRVSEAKAFEVLRIGLLEINRRSRCGVAAGAGQTATYNFPGSDHRSGKRIQIVSNDFFLHRAKIIQT